MKQLIRSFSVGLLTAGIILLIGYYFIDDSSTQAEQRSVDSMIIEIEQEGYRVLTEAEYISISVNKDQDNKSTASTIEESMAEKEEEEDEDSEAEVEDPPEEETSEQDNTATYTLHIEPGMASSTISSVLAENNIIENAAEFNKYLDEQDYSLKVQIGEFELSSTMSFFELAEAITK
ncbi:hypothetical protein QGM71_01930 [Virgibacillus sp. C22-A2]|uniref:YceG-like family protein n=1 Tax=Virgibacillus tibetensis TaxID=3042313 RepID=A0ABU6KB26_9BACI|nr:hypothetical protein [Virgibacillus sp. C22-A2]